MPVTGNGNGIYADDLHAGNASNTLADSAIADNAGDGLVKATRAPSPSSETAPSPATAMTALQFEHGGAEIVGCHIEKNAAAGITSSDRGGSDIHGNWIRATPSASPTAATGPPMSGTTS